MCKISCIIPCYASVNTLCQVVEELLCQMQFHNEEDYEIILIDDCSPDATYNTIQRLCAQDNRIKGITFTKNFGQHAALMAGYRASSGDIVVSLDDDGETPAADVFRLINKLMEGYDVVMATYPQNQHNLFRRAGTHINKRMMEIMMGKPKHLNITSFWCGRRHVIDEMIRCDTPFPYIAGLILRSTNAVVNIPIEHKKRIDGQSGYSFTKLLSLWMNGLTAFSVKPLRMATAVGFVCAVLGIIYGLYLVIKYFVNLTAPAGYSSIMAALLFIGGMIMLMLGLVGEYIGRIFICLNHAPQYVIRDTLGFSKD